MTDAKSERRVAQTIEPEVGDDWPVHGLGPVSAIVPLLPDPGELPPGVWVAVAPGSVGQRGLLKRLFGSSPARARVHLAVRCTALMVRGYTSIATDEAGNAYGLVPR